MSDGETDVGMKKRIPIGVFIISILLVLNGLFALLGSLFYQDNDIDRLYGAASSVASIATGISILMNHRAALPLSFVCAVLLTVDATFRFIPFRALNPSAHAFSDAARTIFNVGLYWVGFLWYKRWRAVCGTETSATPNQTSTTPRSASTPPPSAR